MQRVTRKDEPHVNVESGNEGVDHFVIVIGAGFGGIGAAIKLKAAGIDDFVIVDKADELGGTWRDNVYPGVACDVPVLGYEYSFEPNPDWSQLFASGSEIQAYALHCVEKYRVRPHFRPSVEVLSMRFEETLDRWAVTTSRGTITARYVIYAPGVLTIPTVPNLPGLDTFEGAMCHTARWNVSDQLEGRRVGIIGTGASAMQVIPEVARKAARVHVFQRTPIWVLPRYNPTFPGWMRTLFRRVPATQRLLRLVIRGTYEAFAGVALLNQARAPWSTRLLERLGSWNLRRQVADPELRDRLTPRYAFGCKRMSFSNTYFATFSEDHVELETAGIDRVIPGGIRSLRRTRDRARHPHPGHGVQGLRPGDLTSVRHRGNRWTGPSQPLEGQSIPILRGCRRPGVPEPVSPPRALRDRRVVLRGDRGDHQPRPPLHP